VIGKPQGNNLPHLGKLLDPVLIGKKATKTFPYNRMEVIEEPWLKKLHLHPLAFGTTPGGVAMGKERTPVEILMHVEDHPDPKVVGKIEKILYPLKIPLIPPPFLRLDRPVKDEQPDRIHPQTPNPVKIFFRDTLSKRWILQTLGNVDSPEKVDSPR
jgi:hypothetical protein